MSSRTVTFAALFWLVTSGCALEPFPIPAGSTGGGGPSTLCTGDLDCAPNNPCMVGRCLEGACQYTPSPSGQSCADDDACNGAERCDGAGQCVSGTPVSVDDGDACTSDSCDPATGAVTHEPVAGCGSAFKPTQLTGAPSARYLHSAVWTGSKMVVWGGIAGGSPPVTATGGVYDPATNTWKPTSLVGAPPPRHSHQAVWTGSKMIVWGGYGASGYESTGGLYDPESDTWSPMASTGAPMGRVEFAAAWTGSKMMVWGGTNGASVLGTGGLYDPQSNAWAPVSTTSAPSARYGHSLLAAGSSVIVWGGNDNFDWHDDGRRFDPAAGSWLSTTSMMGVPERREAHSALWTGSTMIVWGGWNGGTYLPSGGIYDPAAGGSGAWTATSTSGAPAGRAQHVALWTGAKMIIWGGCGVDACSTLFGDGAVFTPNAMGGSWVSIAEDTNLNARRRAAGVWTGSEMIVWGGQTKSGGLNTGARYTPPN